MNSKAIVGSKYAFLLVIPVILAVALVYALIYRLLVALEPNSFQGLNQSNSFIDFLYFSLVTVTTTGYGDMHPLTNASKIIASSEIVAGIAVILGTAVYVVLKRARGR